METVVFGYRCQECGRGTVKEQILPEYRTKIKGYPFVVKDARIGKCDVCGTENFAPQETERWERLFEKEHERQFLAPEQIRDLQKSLRLTMEQFAFLIGSTRQSLHNWERPDRNVPQSRMANLLMKLVAESRDKGAVDVLGFLVRDAKEFGVHIEPGKARTYPEGESLVLRVQHMVTDASKAGVPELEPMTADNSETEEQAVALDTETGKEVGVVSYDFETASLLLELAEPLSFESYGAAVSFSDGEETRSDAVESKGQVVTLLKHTRRRAKEVEKILLIPRGNQE